MAVLIKIIKDSESQFINKYLLKARQEFATVFQGKLSKPKIRDY